MKNILLPISLPKDGYDYSINHLLECFAYNYFYFTINNEYQ